MRPREAADEGRFLGDSLEVTHLGTDVFTRIEESVESIDIPPERAKERFRFV